MVNQYFKRDVEQTLLTYQTFFPAIVIIGPRQVGKTSLTLALRNQLANQSVYLDLEQEEDRQQLTNLRSFMKEYEEATILLDEVQRLPELFPALRGIIDHDRRPGRFMLLGSASFDLIRDASETLAGRVAIVELFGLRYREIRETIPFVRHWIRGGFPNALLAPSDQLSMAWRNAFLRTYVERDLNMLGLRVDPRQLRRLLTMLAHQSGQLLNVQTLAKSLQLNSKTVNRYLDILEQTFLIRRLPSYHVNVKKRLVKSPKVYLRDTGILHYLLGLSTFEQLAGHAVYGASFESYVVEELHAYCQFSEVSLSFYRTTTGSEMDLVLERGGRVVGIVDIKAAEAPKLTRGFYTAREDLGNVPAYVVKYGSGPSYTLAEGVTVLGVTDLASIVSDLVP